MQQMYSINNPLAPFFKGELFDAPFIKGDILKSPLEKGETGGCHQPVPVPRVLLTKNKPITTNTTYKEIIFPKYLKYS